MKSLARYILEQTDDTLLDMDWINNDKPVITKSGLNVQIEDVDMTKIPNQLIGKVFYDGQEKPVVGWIWLENGDCVQCKDKYGNGYRPGEDEILIKKLDNK